MHVLQLYYTCPRQAQKFHHIQHPLSASQTRHACHTSSACKCTMGSRNKCQNTCFKKPAHKIGPSSRCRMCVLLRRGAPWASCSFTCSILRMCPTCTLTSPKTSTTVTWHLSWVSNLRSGREQLASLSRTHSLACLIYSRCKAKSLHIFFTTKA